MLNRIRSLSGNNKIIAINIIGSFVVRGAALIISLFTMPAYLRFFNNNDTLGIWYTILSVLNWVLMFDLGLGNGLRNLLPGCMVQKKMETAKEYIASTYFGTFALVLVWSVIGILLIGIIEWNSFLNVSEALVSSAALRSSIAIVFCGIMLQFVLKTINSILYAIQKSAVVNLLTLVSSSLTLFFVCVFPSASIEKNLIHMAIINVISANIPLLVATIVVFSTSLSGCIPGWRHISIKRIKEVLNIGITLLWLTIVMMVISSTNELLITKLTKASYVVDFQIYYKVFNTISSLFTLALAPIWSSVTKATVEKEYSWIKKLYKKLLVMAAGVFLFELAVVPFVQIVVDIWLGKNFYAIDYRVSCIFVLSSSIFFLHNVNTSVCNGMSYFKVQKFWMTFAAVVDIPLAWLLVKFTGSWVGIIIANIIALLPFEIIEIFSFNTMIKDKIQKQQMSNI